MQFNNCFRANSGVSKFYQQQKNTNKNHKNYELGFTLIEKLIVLVIIGIASAIAAPSWLYFLDNWRVNDAVDRILQAKREAQTKADRNNQTWQVSLKIDKDLVKYAVHPANIKPDTVTWYSFDEYISLDVNETTLLYSKGIWKVQFNHKGRTNGQLGRVTLTSKNNPNIKRCVIVSTLLGAIRMGQKQAKAQNGRYCY